MCRRSTSAFNNRYVELPTGTPAIPWAVCPTNWWTERVLAESRVRGTGGECRSAVSPQDIGKPSFMGPLDIYSGAAASTRAHIVPTICPQLHISLVIWRDVFMQVNADPPR